MFDFAQIWISRYLQKKFLSRIQSGTLSFITAARPRLPSDRSWQQILSARYRILVFLFKLITSYLFVYPFPNFALYVIHVRLLHCRHKIVKLPLSETLVWELRFYKEFSLQFLCSEKEEVKYLPYLDSLLWWIFCENSKKKKLDIMFRMNAGFVNW